MELPTPKPSKSERDERYYQLRSENRVRVYEHLKRKGFSNAAIAGIMANIEVETGGSFNPFQKQTATGAPRSAKLRGTGYGLFQLDKGGKRPDYEEWLKDNNKADAPLSYNEELEAQLDYMTESIFEKGKFRDRVGPGNADSVKRYIQTSSDPAQIALEFSNKWEMAGSAHNARRMSEAESILNEINQGQLDRGFMKKMFGRYNEGGMAKQMELFEEGGLMDQGGTTDPVSGNDVPTGSLQKEVRDDIPAQLSEGEFVMPADVVRYHGLDKMMALRDEAKAGLQRMEAMGQMGNADEATIPDGIPFNMDDLDMDDDPLQMQVGGVVPGVTTEASMYQGTPTGFVGIQETAPIQQRIASPYAIAESPAAAPSEYTYQQFLPEVIRETREYVNDQGQILYVPFINGEVMQGYVIPEGYRPRTEADAQPAAPAPVQPTAPVSTADDDPSAPTSEPIPAATTVFGGTVSDGRVYGGTTYEVSYDSAGKTLPGLLGALTGGFNRVTLTDANGRKATMSRDLYNALKEDRRSQKTADIIRNLFQYTDAADTQIRQSSGFESGLFGGNYKELESNAAKAIYDDLGLEYNNQPLSEALMVQAESEKEKTGVTEPTVSGDPFDRPPTTRPEGAEGFEAVPLTSGTVAPDFVARPDVTPTAEGPIYDLTAAAPTGQATMTGSMERADAPQVPVVETRQSPVLPTMVTRPTGDMISLPQPKPTQAQRDAFLYDSMSIPSTGTGIIKTPEMAARLGQESTAAGQELTPLEVDMLKPLERVDYPQSPIFAQSPVVPAFVNTRETMAMPTPAEDIRRLREQRAADTAGDPFDRPSAAAPSSFEVEAMADRDASPAFTSDEVEAMADRDFSRERDRAADSAAAEAQAEAGKIRESFPTRGESRKAREEAKASEYAARGYSPKAAAEAGRNKVAADEQAQRQSGDYSGRTTAVTDSKGNPVKVRDAATGKVTDRVVTSSPPSDDSDSGGGGKSIVCTEMYRQTQLDDWAKAMRIWDVYQKKHLTPAHEVGYHWLFKPYVRGMKNSGMLTRLGAYLAKERTQHLRYVLTKGRAKDSMVGNIWCKVIHPIVYVAGKIKNG